MNITGIESAAWQRLTLRWLRSVGVKCGIDVHSIRIHIEGGPDGHSYIIGAHGFWLEDLQTFRVRKVQFAEADMSPIGANRYIMPQSLTLLDLVLHDSVDEVEPDLGPLIDWAKGILRANMGLSSSEAKAMAEEIIGSNPGVFDAENLDTQQNALALFRAFGAKGKP